MEAQRSTDEIEKGGFSEDMTATAGRIGISPESQKIISEISAQKVEALTPEIMNQWSPETREDVLKCFITASTETRRSLTDEKWETAPSEKSELKEQINLFSFLEKICAFLSKITNETSYKVMMHMYGARREGLTQRLRCLKKPSLNGTPVSEIPREVREAIRARNIPFDQIQ
ncbi:MAG: hypothetical protein Q8P62_02010 [Candidatus Peregrinibacteria bacterium]|nr:hypothetical protein [Candidatus Peregrinibacteria bacterium]